MLVRKSYKAYFFLVTFLLAALSIPLGIIEPIREFAVTIVALAVKPIIYATSPENPSKQQQLELENHFLQREITTLREQLYHPQPFQMEKVEEPLSASRGVPARIIFRSPVSWNSSCWLDVGEETNRQLGYQVVAKNSPVIVGKAVVGVVDYVGQRQSRMRLITDSGLVPSVRAVRGDLQKQMLNESIVELERKLARYAYLIVDKPIEPILHTLSSLREQLQQGSGTWYLAKGELYGTSQPLWRSAGSLLRGTGFNYDFPDEYGPSRDLRTGVPHASLRKGAIPLLKVNDLLITTGMDGVFPAGLHVAEVVKINPLKEGDYYFQLEARPIAGNLQELCWVHIIPPVGYSSEES